MPPKKTKRKKRKKVQTKQTLRSCLPFDFLVLEAIKAGEIRQSDIPAEIAQPDMQMHQKSRNILFLVGFSKQAKKLCFFPAFVVSIDLSAGDFFQKGIAERTEVPQFDFRCLNKGLNKSTKEALWWKSSGWRQTPVCL